jgi:hypothetical protein
MRFAMFAVVASAVALTAGCSTSKSDDDDCVTACSKVLDDCTANCDDDDDTCHVQCDDDNDVCVTACDQDD